MADIFKSLDELKEKLLSGEKIKLKIKAVAGSKSNSIEFLEEFAKIKIKDRAIEGKANKAIIDFLASELRFPKTKINILNGHKSSIKTIELG